MFTYLRFLRNIYRNVHLYNDVHLYNILYFFFETHDTAVFIWYERMYMLIKRKEIFSSQKILQWAHYAIFRVIENLSLEKNKRRKFGCLDQKPQLKIYLKIPWNTETEINNIITNNTDAKIINFICYISYVTCLQPMLFKIRGFRNSCRLDSVDCKNRFIFFV